MSKQRTSFVAVGFLGGVAAGTIIWSRLQRHYRRNLFHRHTLRRVAALGYLRATLGQHRSASARIRRLGAASDSPRARSEDAETSRVDAVTGGR